MTRNIETTSNCIARRTLTAALVATAFACWASSAAAVTVWTGSSDNTWDIATTPNWTGGTGSIYTDGDSVQFDNSGINTSINVAVPVSPGTITFNNTSTTPYSFTGAAVGGIGSTTLTSSGAVTYSPTGAGPHSFGGGSISLNGGGQFIFNPVTASTSLTNNFNINSVVTWDRAGNSGVRTGTVTVNSDFNLRSDGTSGGIMEADMILTANRQITGGRFGSLATIPQITGDVSSSGGPHTLTLRHTGQNPDWQWIIGNSTATAPDWNIQNLIRTSGASTATRSGTLVFNLDERIFFDNIEANGGRVVLEGSTKFSRSAAVDVEFDMIFNENNAFNNANTVYIGSGFRQNNKLNIKSGGLLGGNGIIRRRDDLGAGPNPLPVDVEVLAGGQISPGDYALADTTDVLTINGDVVFNGGMLAIDITGGGGVPGVDFDQLVVTDSDTPSGRGNVSGLSTATLQVDFNNVSFAALDGNSFDILTSLNDLSGQSFGGIEFMNAGFNLEFDVIYGNGVITLTNFSTFVPEPSSLMLLGLGTLLLTQNRRRKRG